jgi:IS30 family transposase
VSYSQLSQEERYQIERMLQEGLKVSQIALRLGRHRSTLYRELNRTAGKRYRARIAQRHRDYCGQRSSSNAARYASSAWTPVRRRLARQWSPQQIAGRAQLQGKPCASWQAIYGWIKRCWVQRQQRPLRRAQRRASNLGWARRARPIAQRPAAVRQRLEIGHWESDTMVGTRGCYKPRLLVSVERVSRYTRLSLMPDALPRTVARQLQQDLLGSQRWPVHSLTVDRGAEFSHLPDVLERDRLFVCDPQRPNQRGTNENTIGLVRQYIPKGQPLSLQTPESIARIERLLNSRPRACLGFRTPAEVLFEAHHRCRSSNAVRTRNQDLI